MPPAVLDAFRKGAAASVSIEHLQAAASRCIAEITQTDAGLVTAGSAAGLTLGAAAILCGSDPGRMERLPQCDDIPHEFIVAREQRSGYDHAVRASGARLVEVGFNEIVAGAGVRRTEVWEYEAAIGPSTAGIFYVYAPDSQPPLDALVALAREHRLPVLVDAAGEVPPRENLRAITATGVDLVSFSGGKAIRGPQSTGILCGRRDLITSTAMQMLDMDDHWELWEPPADWIDKSQFQGIARHGIGRALKVSKEEIVALLTALELFDSGAYDDELPKFRGYLDSICHALDASPVECEIVDFPDGERLPILEISLTPRSAESAFDVCRRLRQGAPPVYVGHGKLAAGKLVVQPLCLQDEQIALLGERLKDELAN